MVSKVRGSKIVAVLSVLMLLLVGCGESEDPPADTEVDEPETDADAEQDAGTDAESDDAEDADVEGDAAADGGAPVTLNVGTTQTTAAFLPIYVADAQGMFTDRNLDVRILEFGGGTEVLRGLVAGSVDIGAGPVTDVLAGAAQDQPIKMIWSMNEAPVYELYGREDWSGPEDIEPGSQFAISGQGGLSHNVTMYMIEGFGHDPDEMEYVVSGGPTERLAALLSGQVDAALLASPSSLQAESEGMTQLGTIGDVVDEWQHEIYYASEDYIDEREDAIASFLEASNEAAEFIETNREETVAIIEEYVGLTAEDAADALEGYVGHFSTDGEIAADGFNVLAEFHAEGTDEVDEPFTIEELTDRRFIEQLGSS